MVGPGRAKRGPVREAFTAMARAAGAVAGAIAICLAIVSGCSNPLLSSVKQSVDQYAPNLVIFYGGAELPASAIFDLGSAYVGLPIDYVFTIENKGANELSLTGASRVLVTGSPSFAVQSQPPAAIAAGGKAVFTLRCQPTASGIDQCDLSIASNDPDNGLMKITPRVNAINLPTTKLALFRGAAEIPNGGYVDFGVTAPGDTGSVTFIVRNRSAETISMPGSPAVQLSGADASLFQVTSQPAATSLAPGAETSFTISFSPADSVARTASVSIANDVAGENPFQFSVGVAPQVEVLRQLSAITHGGSIDIGLVRVGQFSDATITLKNVGSVDLHLTGGSPVTVATGDVSMQSAPGTPTIPHDGTTTFTLRFAPSAVGVGSSDVTVNSDSREHAAFAFSVTGTGISPVIDISKGGVPAPSGATLNLDPVMVGTSGDTAFTISNLGSAPLELLGGTPFVAISGADAALFSIVALPSQFVSAGASTGFTLRFTPGTVGTKSATLTIANDDPAKGSYTIPISVEATEFGGARTVDTMYKGRYNAISVSGQYVYIAHWFSTYTRIRLSRSLNGGASWSTVDVDPLDGPPSTNKKTAYGPLGVAQSGANVYVAYSFLDKTSTWKYYLQLATSTDYGQTFAISTIDNAIALEGMPVTLAVDGGNLYVAYQVSGALKFAKSSNGGLTWPTKLTVDAPAANVGNYARIAVNGLDVYIVHYDSTNFDLKLSHSTDGGGTWSTAVVDSTNDSGTYCNIAVSGSSVYLVYQRLTDRSLRLASSTDKGAAWSFAVLDAGGVNAWVWPSVAVSGSKVHVSYYTDWGSYYYLHGSLAYIRSDDGAATWTGVNLLDWEYSGRFSAIAAQGSNVYIGYADNYFLETDSSNLLFLKSNNGGVSW
jgi:hypothetical protein